jgi:hypothetical protein
MKDSTTTLAYGASLGTTALSFNVNEIVAIGGLALAVITCAINWYYKHRHYQLALRKAKDHGSEDDDR